MYVSTVRTIGILLHHVQTVSSGSNRAHRSHPLYTGDHPHHQEEEKVQVRFAVMIDVSPFSSYNSIRLLLLFLSLFQTYTIIVYMTYLDYLYCSISIC